MFARQAHSDPVWGLAKWCVRRPFVTLACVGRDSFVEHQHTIFLEIEIRDAMRPVDLIFRVRYRRSFFEFRKLGPKVAKYTHLADSDLHHNVVVWEGLG